MALTTSRIAFTASFDFSGFPSVATGVTAQALRAKLAGGFRWIDTVGLANRIQGVGYVAGTLAASASVSPDLTAINGLDNLPINFTRIAAAYIIVTGTTGSLRVGNGTNPHPLWFGAATQTWDLYPGGPPLMGGNPVSTSGIAVTALIKTVKLLNLSATDTVGYVALFGGAI